MTETVRALLVEEGLIARGYVKTTRALRDGLPLGNGDMIYETDTGLFFVNHGDANTKDWESISGDAALPASPDQYGVTKLSALPEVANDPIAVGTNDQNWKDAVGHITPVEGGSNPHGTTAAMVGAATEQALIDHAGDDVLHPMAHSWANLPTPGDVGRIKVVVDSVGAGQRKRVLYDDGSAWITVGVTHWEDLEGKTGVYTPVNHASEHHWDGPDPITPEALRAARNDIELIAGNGLVGGGTLNVASIEFELDTISIPGVQAGVPVPFAEVTLDETGRVIGLREGTPSGTPPARADRPGALKVQRDKPVSLGEAEVWHLHVTTPATMAATQQARLTLDGVVYTIDIPTSIDTISELADFLAVGTNYTPDIPTSGPTGWTISQATFNNYTVIFAAVDFGPRYGDFLYEGLATNSVALFERFSAGELPNDPWPVALTEDSNFSELGLVPKDRRLTAESPLVWSSDLPDPLGDDLSQDRSLALEVGGIDSLFLADGAVLPSKLQTGGTFWITVNTASDRLNLGALRRGQHVFQYSDLTEWVFNSPDGTLADIGTWVNVTSGGGSSGGASAGDMKFSGRFSAEVGWADADGAAVSRSTEASLFAAITMGFIGSNLVNSNQITGITDTSKIEVGMPVEGNGIAAGVTVASKTANSITLSANITQANTDATFRVLPWGQGNGTTTFNKPDLRGRVPVGWTPSALTNIAQRRVGTLMGQDTVALTTAQVPAHSHTITNFANHNHQDDTGGVMSNIPGGGTREGINWSNGAMTGASGGHDHGGATGSAGSGDVHENIQPSAVGRWYVKL